MLIGVLEFSYTFFDRLAVKNTSLASARRASSEGYNLIADWNILQTAKKESAGLGTDDVSLVIVYKASSYTASVPAACKTASVTNSCNRYTGADFAKAQSYFGCAATDLDRYWCPTSRKSALLGTNGPPDYIGVYVEGVHHKLTPLLGSTMIFKTDTVMRIEPTKLS